ncbi:ferredoxin [Saccharothrix coeruleofusca]|uniref:Ferredoxin n=1 Tax=Saccharothrix coeruleofusca TaxID=33919 RepID=A0A918AQ60_9PSEU|nr:ferredoxin [Saccharothrix coeruleofusca]MBP2334947.1 sulfoxide reductase heme-binding subunit YedZ [Saccharothrix coeruleofusca]GGP68122.1 ferredoxin [Saccharothrix coeruleofusca]
MLHSVDLVFAAGISPHDNGVRQMAALSARLAYLMMCLTLCWGVLTATGWVRRVTGHQALRGGHMMLAAFTLGAAATHALAFLFLDERVLTGLELVVPFMNGQLRHALGIIAFDLMVAIAITAGLHRFFRYRNWLRFHQFAYAAIALGVAHSWWGAWANSDIDLWWIGGLTAAAPALVLTAMRVAPPAWLVRAGLIDGETGTTKRLDKTAPMVVSVDNQRCHRYGFCQAEAPDVFQLREDGRLQYRQHPDVARNQDVRSAARACPMRAIQLQGAEK